MSAYISVPFSIHSVLCDAFLQEYVSPLIARLRASNAVKTWFFVRYSDSELGSHLRLRLLTEEAAGVDHVLLAVEDLVANACAREAGEMSSIRLRWVPYEPEIERYGGHDGVRLAEQFFCFSSDAALSVIARCSFEDRRRRLAQALLAMVATAGSFYHSRSAVAAFLGRYVAGYLPVLAPDAGERAKWMRNFEVASDSQMLELRPVVQSAWRNLRRGPRATEPLGAYTLSLRQLRFRLRRSANRGDIAGAACSADTFGAVTNAVVPSYVHMMMNKLGVSIPEETFLAHVARRALEPNRGDASG
ncbi:MAG: hypothetical protein HY059_07445 [Proteobacteria bacterium]|nr:hypothetical protein [Pseudomonadota bacterium]